MPRTDPSWRTALYADSIIDGFVLEVEAEGITGIGATAALVVNVAADDLAAQLSGPLRGALLGSDPFAANAIREHLRKLKLHSRARIAADLALNDWLGKMVEAPCHVLWGGAVRSEVTVIRAIGIKAPADLVSAAGALVEQGFTHLKIKLGTGIDEDIARVRILRETFGSRIWIGVDGNGAYKPDEAIALSHALEAHEVGLIEQPVAPADIDGLARVTAASRIAIMADQCVRDVPSALKICQRGAAHVVSVKLTKMGSVQEARRVTELCEAFGVGVHIGGSVAPAAVDAAQVQFASTMPWIASECEAGEFLAVRGDLCQGLECTEGRMAIRDVPGLGIHLDAASKTS